jgi:hypothetical protein
MATELGWKNTDANMQWSLGPQSDKDGRQEMQDGLLAADVRRMGQVKNGFHTTQSGDQKRGERDSFDACCQEDERKVYNMGRRILGLGPV